jgi:hypothetical protein
MSDSVIRLFIRRTILAEKAANVEAAKGLAMLKIKEGPGLRIVVYEPNAALHAFTAMKGEVVAPVTPVKVGPPIARAIQDAIIGQIKVAPPDGDCNGGWEVHSIAAEKGYGPMMYDIAMSSVPTKTLVPDRESVKPGAEAVWQRYLDTKTGPHGAVEPHQLQDPKSCKLHPSDRPALNYSYTLKGSVNTTFLSANHDSFVEKAIASVRELGLPGKDEDLKKFVFSRLVTAAGNYFTKKY